MTSLHDLSPSPSAIVGQKLEQRALLTAPRRLPIDLQWVIELHYWEKPSSSEIAEVLDIPAGTVRSRLRRAREQIEVELCKLASVEVAAATVSNFDAWAASVKPSP